MGLFNLIERQREEEVLRILDGYAAGDLTAPDERASASAAAADIRRQIGMKTAGN